jgi:hypothetical protein
MILSAMIKKDKNTRDMAKMCLERLNKWHVLIKEILRIQEIKESLLHLNLLFLSQSVIFTMAQSSRQSSPGNLLALYVKELELKVLKIISLALHVPEKVLHWDKNKISMDRDSLQKPFVLFVKDQEKQ